MIHVRNSSELSSSIEESLLQNRLHCRESSNHNFPEMEYYP